MMDTPKKKRLIIVTPEQFGVGWLKLEGATIREMPYGEAAVVERDEDGNVVVDLDKVVGYPGPLV